MSYVFLNTYGGIKFYNKEASSQIHLKFISGFSKNPSYRLRILLRLDIPCLCLKQENSSNFHILIYKFAVTKNINWLETLIVLNKTIKSM